MEMACINQKELKTPLPTIDFFALEPIFHKSEIWPYEHVFIGSSKNCWADNFMKSDDISNRRLKELAFGSARNRF